MEASRSPALRPGARPVSQFRPAEGELNARLPDFQFRNRHTLRAANQVASTKSRLRPHSPPRCPADRWWRDQFAPECHIAAHICRSSWARTPPPLECHRPIAIPRESRREFVASPRRRATVFARIEPAGGYFSTAIYSRHVCPILFRPRRAQSDRKKCRCAMLTTT
jgi:hypothetical protein